MCHCGGFFTICGLQSGLELGCSQILNFYVLIKLSIKTGYSAEGLGSVQVCQIMSKRLKAEPKLQPEKLRDFYEPILVPKSAVMRFSKYENPTFLHQSVFLLERSNYMNLWSIWDFVQLHGKPGLFLAINSQMLTKHVMALGENNIKWISKSWKARFRLKWMETRKLWQMNTSLLAWLQLSSNCLL